MCHGHEDTTCLLFALGILPGKLFLLLICFVWVGSGTCHGNTPFCFVVFLLHCLCVHEPNYWLACGKKHRRDRCASLAWENRIV